jgi:hypothetical protein
MTLSQLPFAVEAALDYCIIFSVSSYILCITFGGPVQESKTKKSSPTHFASSALSNSLNCGDLTKSADLGYPIGVVEGGAGDSRMELASLSPTNKPSSPKIAASVSSLAHTASFIQYDKKVSLGLALKVQSTIYSISIISC